MIVKALYCVAIAIWVCRVCRYRPPRDRSGPIILPTLYAALVLVAVLVTTYAVAQEVGGP